MLAMNSMPDTGQGGQAQFERNGPEKGVILQGHTTIRNSTQRNDRFYWMRRLALFGLCFLSLSVASSVSASEHVSAATVCSATSYTVKAGDTLSGIAAHYKVNW